MKSQFILFSFLVLLVCHTKAQQTVGLFINSSDAFEGYTLFAPINSNETYLIDNCGEKVHSWSSDYRPGLSCYLLEDGTLLRRGRVVSMGEVSGIVEMIDWEGNVIWDYSAFATHGKQHHDIELLPNGNILLIVNDERPASELEAAGSATNNASIISEQIIEIEPNLLTGETTVVWEWKAFDHIIQDVDSNKPFFGVVAEHPERIDINFLDHSNSDWLHFNAVDYNEEFDQIILSSRTFSEFWIIDHSTTTSEATGSTGGRYGQGGDLLYRWGNPRAYDQGTQSDRKLFFQHDTHWIPNGHVDAGKILLFNNQAGTPEAQDYSTVNIVDIPVDADGFYVYNGDAYGPQDFDWTYQADIPTDFFSKFISGVQRLENGNTLICEGLTGRVFEIDENDNVVWEYINPVNNIGAIAQNTIAQNNNVFRCMKYATDYSAFDDKVILPQGYIESGSTFECSDVTAVEDNIEIIDFAVSILPNPTSDYLRIQVDGDINPSQINGIKIYDLNTSLVYQSQFVEDLIDVNKLPSGIYVVQFDFGKQMITKKLFIE